MHVVRKMGTLLLSGAIACTLLAACHGNSNSSTGSTSPPTIGTFACPVVTNTSTVVGVAVQCTATGAISADGAGVTYAWSFGDQTTTTNTPANAVNPVTHYYLQPGNYTVTLSVTDDHGTSATRAKVIVISVSDAVAAKVAIEGVESWSWIGGPKYANSIGTFETQLTPSSSNQPSSRQNASSWTSPQGKLWMFGGAGYDSVGTTGLLNDLWVYDPAQNCSTTTSTTCTTSGQQWTWVSGSNKANVIGVYPIAYGVTSSTNVIGARNAAAQWTDNSGQFWLFGGSGYDKNGNISYLNDLWMLNSQTGNATWEAGSATGNNAGAGTQAIAGATPTTNSPSGRAFATTWVDQHGVFWLFGGQNTNSSGTLVMLDDLWSYDPNAYDATAHPNGQKGWILVKGSPTTNNVPGTYGTLGVASTANYPGSRVSAQAWTDNAGNLWLFGGSGYGTATTSGSLNDLWEFNPTTGTWTWVAGSNTVGAAGVYGTQGSTVTGSGGLNTPGARVGTLGWTDTSGNLWLFGGSGSDSTGTAASSDGGGALNELWSFNIATGHWAWMGGVSTAGAPGVYVDLAATPTPTPSKYNSPGARVWGAGWADGKGNFWLFGGAGIDSSGTSGYLNDFWNVQFTVQPTNQ